jgi:hypothetical protein
MSRASGTPKTGDRKKGTPNKATAARQAEIAASRLTPLELQTQKYRYYYAIIEAELAKPNPNYDLIDDAWMAGGIAARDAAPYVHPRVNPIEEKPQVTVMQWNWTKELLDKLPDIRRGKPFRPYISEQSGKQQSSITHEPDVSRNSDQSDERREEAIGPSNSISPSP